MLCQSCCPIGTGCTTGFWTIFATLGAFAFLSRNTLLLYANQQQLHMLENFQAASLSLFRLVPLLQFLYELTCCRNPFLGSSKLFPLPPKEALILARTVPANPNAITLQWDKHNYVYCILDDNAKLFNEIIWLPELTSSGNFGLPCAVMCCDMTLGTSKYYNISRATWPWYIQCGWWWMEATAACRQFWVCIISTA